MIAIPQPINLTKNFTAIWDAWNRLVELRENRLLTPVDPQSGDPVENMDPVFVDRIIARYEYDSVNRRIVIQEYSQESGEKSKESEGDTSGSVLERTRHLYYTTGWQLIEERSSSADETTLPANWFNSSSYLAQQFVWNAGYVDDLILRDRDTNVLSGGVGDGILDERLYSLTDLRFSVMALANPAGTIVERFRYEAHGRSIALTADFTPRPINIATGDGSAYSWENRYTGRELDLQTGLYHFRNRYYHADLGRFITRDLLGYVDGMSLYRGFFVPKGNDFTGTQDSDEFSNLLTDQEGRELLIHWFFGEGETKRIVFDKDWSVYMMRSETLRGRLSAELQNKALELSNKKGNFTEFLQIRLDPEVLIGTGEGIVGYDFLGGAHSVYIEGTASVTHTDPNTPVGNRCCNVEFQLHYIWYDKMDPKPEKYTSDIIKAALGKTITFGRARDYDLEIKWKRDSAILWDKDGVRTFVDWPFQKHDNTYNEHGFSGGESSGGGASGSW